MVWMQAGLRPSPSSALVSTRCRPSSPLRLCSPAWPSFPAGRASHWPGSTARSRCHAGRHAACAVRSSSSHGFFIMIGAQIEDQGVFFQSVVDPARACAKSRSATSPRLSPSDTLADALGRCVHSLQEDFPVVRGPGTRSASSRASGSFDALAQLAATDACNLVMSRAFQVARPEDTLSATIRRLTARPSPFA